MKPPKSKVVLGIETATPNGGAALVDADRCLGSFTRWGGRLHSQRMMTGLRDLLRDLGLEPVDLAAIAVSIGPGSFTGVRVGLAAAKALAYAVGVPLIGIPTLEAFAFRAAGIDAMGAVCPGSAICPILDARRGEVYWATFELCPPATVPAVGLPPAGQTDSPSVASSTSAIASASSPPGPALLRLTPDTMTKALRLAEALAAIQPPTRELLVCGEGALHLRDVLAVALGPRLHLAPPQRMAPGPEEIAWLGLHRLRAGRIDDPMTLTPVYLREPDVQFPRTLQNQGKIGPP